MRRIISFFLALLLFCSLAFPASAASDEFLASLRECIQREMSYTASRMTSVETITVNDSVKNIFQNDMVWITNLDEKNHSKADCGGADASKSYQIVRSVAVSGGYEQCDRCW